MASFTLSHYNRGKKLKMLMQISTWVSPNQPLTNSFNCEAESAAHDEAAPQVDQCTRAEKVSYLTATLPNWPS